MSVKTFRGLNLLHFSGYIDKFSWARCSLSIAEINIRLLLVEGACKWLSSLHWVIQKMKSEMGLDKDHEPINDTCSSCNIENYIVTVLLISIAFFVLFYLDPEIFQIFFFIICYICIIYLSSG